MFLEKDFTHHLRPKETLCGEGKAMCPVWYVCDICDREIVGRVYFFEFEDDGDLPGRNVVVCDNCRTTAVEYRGAIRVHPTAVFL